MDGIMEMKAIRTVLVFLRLKVLEIGRCLVALCVFWVIGACVSEAEDFPGIVGYFFPVLFGFAVVVALLLVLGGLNSLCQANWKKAKKIVEGKR